MSKLKPCPFCGREAELGEVDWDCHPPEDRYVVKCIGIYYDQEKRDGLPVCAMGDSSRSFKTAEEAIAAWNRRHTKARKVKR